VSLVHRYINVSFSNVPGFDTNIDLKGLRVSASIVYPGSQMGTANLIIYGLSRSHLNSLSTLGPIIPSYPRYHVSITAGDDESGMSLVFSGFVTSAWADMQTAPGVVMHVLAQADIDNQVKPSGKDTSATSYKGGVKASTIMEKLAAQMGLKFENNNVDQMIHDAYQFGSLREQFHEVAKTVKAEHTTENDKIVVWPAGQMRGGGTLEVSKKTGMVGIPGFTLNSIFVKVLFKRFVPLGIPMHVVSEVIFKINTTTWQINRTEYSLESMMPHGDWFVTIFGTNSNFGTAQVGQSR